MGRVFRVNKGADGGVAGISEQKADGLSGCYNSQNVVQCQVQTIQLDKDFTQDFEM